MSELKAVKENQITNGVIWKQILIFFFPIAAGTIVQQLYNVADAAIVGRFVGKEALASVGGSASVLTSMVIYFFSGLATGAGVVVSQYYGAKNQEAVQKSLHTAYAFAMISSVVLAIAGWFAAPKLLEIMDTPSEIMKDSIVYMRIFCIGLIATLTYNMGAAIMRAVGDSRRPLYYLIISSVLNIILDIIFIVVFHWGIAGAAAATVIAQAVSSILALFALSRSYDMLEFRFRELRIYKNIFIAEFKIGVPGGISFCISSITSVILQTAINGFGTDTTAAWAAFNKIDMIFWALLSAFGAAITTFSGQNYGARKYDRMWKSVRICLGLSLVVCGITQIGLYLFCRPMFAVFTTDSGVIEIGVHMMRFLVPTYIFYIFLEIPAGALRGMGDVIIPTVFNLMGTILLKIPWILFVLPIYHTIEMVMITYLLSGLFAMVLTVIYYFRKKRKFAEMQRVVE